MLTIEPFIDYSGLCVEDATSALKRAEGYVSSILGDIVEARKTETYHGNGEMALVLKRSPLVTVHTLKFSDVLQDTADYFPDEAGIIHMNIAFPRGFNVIEVDYTAGWTEATMPTNLKYTIYELAMKIAKAGDSYGSNVKSESIDGASISWGDIEKSKEDEVINSFKKIYV